MPYPAPFEPIPLETRDGRLMAGDTPVHANGGPAADYQTPHGTRSAFPISEDTARELGLDSDFFTYGHPAPHARILRCYVCDAYYIGHWATKTCSAECRRSQTARATAHRKRERRRQYQLGRDDLPEFCEMCSAGMDAKRSRRRYCSSACRQRAHRERQRPPRAR